MDSAYHNGERWRELRSQGARLDAAARFAPDERRPEPLRDRAGAAEPLGSIWVVAPSYSLAAAGLEKALEDKADVRVGARPDTVRPSCLVLCAEGMAEGLAEGVGRVRGLYPGVPLLVFGQRLDLALAWSALRNGADGYVHAAMDPAQVVRALEAVQRGELAAPRQLLRYLLSREEAPDLGDLSARQQEVLELVVEGLSNAEIARRLFLSESTIKQHLRAAYKLLGVRNRTEAAKAMKDHARGLQNN